MTCSQRSWTSWKQTTVRMFARIEVLIERVRVHSGDEDVSAAVVV
eukprot:CAMPEP_0172927346 /NCGR_PEP_ID=MMETSP1075-20121228/217331_1 /TAXON_ID=2916 /ORGANISM="Ceratium fusus, Strain PA161109" /LENGTH=44 /DNA_ID= /DNA_START= /DNA_END= /DNA_ORIENTATION=